jgi:CubicO group peptidase (beta-lactamase class C family)
MKPTTILLLAALVLFIRVNANAQSYSTETQQKIKQVEENILPEVQTEGDKPMSITERMAFYKVHGVSLAVIHNYKLVWAKGYGSADDSLQTPVTTKTLFQAGSVSKSLNAVGVLKLVQDKKIDLYADINNYLTSWKFPYDSLSKNKKISVANLLSHTAGLTVHGFGGYARGKTLPTVVQVLDGQKPAYSPKIRSMYPPGLKPEYSGGGITISQLIVMDVTHQPYDQYMYNHVLKPMGMTASTYTQPPVNVQPATLLAAGYRADGKPVFGKYNIYPEEAAAGLWTNPTDLAKYIIETQLAYEGKSHKVLDQQTTKLRLTPYLNNVGALGVFIDSLHNGEKYFGHDGADNGFRAQYFGSFEGGNGVVVMVNSDDSRIITDIISSVARVYDFKRLNRTSVRKIVAVADTVLQSYTGNYELEPGFILAVTREGNHLYGKAGKEAKLELFPESQNKFFLKVADIELEFIKDDKGEISHAIVYQNGAYNAKKLK